MSSHKEKGSSGAELKKIATTVRTEAEQFETTVREMIEAGLTNKTAIIRQLTPTLEKMNDAGFRYEKLVEIMNAAGLEITLTTFKTIRARLGKETNKDA
jgi:hypothetical protein